MLLQVFLVTDGVRLRDATFNVSHWLEINM